MTYQNNQPQQPRIVIPPGTYPATLRGVSRRTAKQGKRTGQEYLEITVKIQGQNNAAIRSCRDYNQSDWADILASLDLALLTNGQTIQVVVRNYQGDTGTRDAVYYNAPKPGQGQAPAQGQVQPQQAPPPPQQPVHQQPPVQQMEMPAQQGYVQPQQPPQPPYTPTQEEIDDIPF